MNTLWKEFIKYINSKNINSFITRQEIIKEFDNKGLLSRYINGTPFTQTLDTYRRTLTKGNYLEDTNKKGVYKFIRYIREDISSSKCKKQAYEKN